MMIDAPGAAEKVKRFFSRYKAAVILLALGLALVLLARAGKSPAPEQPAEAPREPEFSLAAEEKRFAAALERIDGAGEVEVVLTLKSGVSRTLAENESSSYESAKEQGDTRLESKKEAVLTSSGGSERSPVTLSYSYPEYQGALVVCRGAGEAYVRLAVTQAMSALTGLGTDKISVVKMD